MLNERVHILTIWNVPFKKRYFFSHCMKLSSRLVCVYFLHFSLKTRKYYMGSVIIIEMKCSFASKFFLQLLKLTFGHVTSLNICSISFVCNYVFNFCYKLRIYVTSVVPFGHNWPRFHNYFKVPNKPADRNKRAGR